MGKQNKCFRVRTSVPAQSGSSCASKPRHETMANESSTADHATVVAAADARYTFDVKKLEELRKSSPWRDDPRYFKGVAIGPSAVMKMVSR